MDQARYEQLLEKRKGTGLSDAEANELGRLMAEMAGRAEDYTNAQEHRMGPADAYVRGPAEPPPPADPGGDPAQRDAAGDEGREEG